MEKYKNKVFFSAILTFFFILFLTSPVSASISLLVDGQEISSQIPPQLINGRTVVPLRAVGEALKLEVLWDEAQKTVVLNGENINITLPVGKTEAIVNEKPVPLDVPAMIIEESTMIPIRFISEQLGAEVQWDSGNQVVTISTKDIKPTIDNSTTVSKDSVETQDNVILSGTYKMTGEALILLPDTTKPQTLQVSGWFDLSIEENNGKYKIFKRKLGGNISELILPEEMANMLSPTEKIKSVSASLELDSEATQTGDYNPATGEFWMLSSLLFQLPELYSLGGPYPVVALERGTLDPNTAAYSSQVSLAVLSDPLSGTTVLFSKGGSRQDSLEDIQRLLDKDSLTDEERERIRNYLRESQASEADKIQVLKDLIELAQDASGEAVLITPTEVIDAIIAGIRNIEERMYRTYKQMRDSNIISGPEDFPNGTLEQRRKYEMRYLLEKLKDKLN